MNMSLSIVFTFLLFACNSTRNIFGIYRSKFAVNGFFGTRVKLNSDSTFTYRMSGDMVYDTAAGQFQVHQRFLILRYKSLAVDSSSEYTVEKESISVHEALTGNHNLHEPIKYIFGHNKLFLTNINGLKVNRQWGYSKHKKFILFGKSWYMRKYYLKRIN